MRRPIPSTRRSLVSLLALILLIAPGWTNAQPTFEPAGDWEYLLTAAERSDFQATTRYDEVFAFVESVATMSANLHRARMGYTLEGREIPLVVAGKDLTSSSPEAVRSSEKLRVFILANIHAGEVCGKEAMLTLLRHLAAGQYDAWLDDLVLIVAPIYNADGNERVQMAHRGVQNGPHAGMGQRENAQGLDLNRDHLKLVSPEATSLIQTLQAYDPHVLIDLHTTNGTKHGFHLTYSPPLHPDTDPEILALQTEVLLPNIRARMAERSWATYDYGNLLDERRDADGQLIRAAGWYTFDHRARFGTNYGGLRNRLTILSEAYAYLPFRERVEVTYDFVVDILDELQAGRDIVSRVTRAADQRATAGLDSLTLSARPRLVDPVAEIPMRPVDVRTHPYLHGETYFERSANDALETITVAQAFTAFEASRKQKTPEAYLIPDTLTWVVDRLRTHGLVLEQMSEPRPVTVSSFMIDATTQAGRLYQGVLTRSASGRWHDSEETVGPGWIRVPMRQPLARIAFHLLEPESDDGLVHWALMDNELQEGTRYPILRELP